MTRNLDDRADPHDVALSVLLEEYRALYSMLIFRLGAIEQRVPATWAVLTASVGGSALMPASAGPLVQVAIPLIAVGFFRSTLAHARSKHDIKLRIDEIEREVNRLAKRRLLAFQSEHPSRGTSVGGRSGRQAVFSVFLGTLALLAGCAWTGLDRFTTDESLGGYLLYVASCGLIAAIDLARLGRYRRRQQFLSRG
jgi:hypothetical protein